MMTHFVDTDCSWYLTRRWSWILQLLIDRPCYISVQYKALKNASFLLKSVLIYPLYPSHLFSSWLYAHQGATPHFRLPAPWATEGQLERWRKNVLLPPQTPRHEDGLPMVIQNVHFILVKKPNIKVICPNL